MFIKSENEAAKEQREYQRLVRWYSCSSLLEQVNTKPAANFTSSAIQK